MKPVIIKLIALFISSLVTNLLAQTFTLESITPITNGTIWCIPVYDGSNLVVSAESSRGIALAKYDLDLNQLGAAVTVASTNDTADCDNIADHKHIFQNYCHYLTFSTGGGGQGGYLYLLKLDRDFARMAFVTVVTNDPPTNDMLMVGDGTNVYVGKFLPGIGHRLYKYDASLNYLGVQIIGGGENQHGNGAAALYRNGCFHLVAPESLQPSNSHYIARIVYDSAWKVVENRATVLADSSGLLGISSGLLYEPVDGSFIMHYQRSDGPVCCATFNSRWNLLTNSSVIEGIWSRPHSVIVGNKLYVGYDGTNINVARFSISNSVSPVTTSTPSFFIRDFDGDRLGDPLLVSSNEWKVWLSGNAYAQRLSFQFPAIINMTPFPSDFDGDRLADPAGFTNCAWAVYLSGSNYQFIGPEQFGTGTEFVAAAADYDGDALADPAIYIDGQWTAWLSSMGYWRVGPVSLGGGSNALVVSADYDGDGKADPALWEDGGWRAWLSGVGYVATARLEMNVGNNDLPAACDLDGDCLADPSVYAGNNTLYFWASSAAYRRIGPCILP